MNTYGNHKITLLNNYGDKILETHCSEIIHSDFHDGTQIIEIKTENNKK